MSFTAQLATKNRVRLDVTSDIPGTVELMASVSLAGQADDDIWVGVNDRVRLSRGKGSVTLNTAKLPRGQFEVEVDFYPNWGLVDVVAQRTKIQNEMHAAVTLDLAGSGESTGAAKQRVDGRDWVMSNFRSGMRWDAGTWISRFGEPEGVAVDEGNPRILAAYYFRSIDMTLIVNLLEGEVVAFRDGIAHH